MVNLRPLVESDLEFLLEVRNHPSTRGNLEDNSEFSLENCKTWFKNTNPKWFIIEAFDYPILYPVGYIRTKGDEVGCDIHPNERKKGYARKAYKLYLKDKDYASLWVFENNFAKNLYEKLGFTPTGDSKLVRGENYIKMEYNG